MFDVKRNQKLDDQETDSEYVLLFNSEPVSNIRVEKRDGYSENLFQVEALFGYETNFLLGFKVRDFTKFTSYLVLRNWIIQSDYEWTVEILFKGSKPFERSFIEFTLSSNLIAWKKITVLQIIKSFLVKK